MKNNLHGSSINHSFIKTIMVEKLVLNKVRYVLNNYGQYHTIVEIRNS